MTGMSATPYGTGAKKYLHKGWSPLPLPPRMKKSPPTGWTGYGRPHASLADVSEWQRNGKARCNIGLRCPETVLGIDVDAYDGKPGGKTFADAAIRLGPLPESPRSSSRPDDPISGIRYYRVPAGRQWADTLGGKGSGVEILHHGHRYGIAYPSIHPEGRVYQWYGTGDEYGPAVDDLPLLPEAWVAELDCGDAADRRVKLDVEDEEVRAWLEALPEGPPCPYLQRLLDELTDTFESNAGRHDAAVPIVAKIIRGGDQGHLGANEAVDTVEAMLRGCPEPEGQTRGLSDSNEMNRMVGGAAAFCIAEPTAQSNKGCCGHGDVEDLLGETTAATDSAQQPPSEGDAPPGGQEDAESPSNDYDGFYLSCDELDNLPEPEPLIDGVLNRHCYAILRGRDGTYKSFTALDWALCVATGRPWQGRPVEQGKVLYIAGEGAYGLAARVAAWKATWEPVKPDAFTVRTAALDMHKPGPAFIDLLRRIKEVGYTLVIVDTLRRVSGRADGNSTDMGAVVDNFERIKRATVNGSVLAITHTDKGDNDSRGFSGIEDDADIVWHAQRFDDSRVMSLINKKMKDGPDGLRVDLQALAVDDSLVLEAWNGEQHIGEAIVTEAHTAIVHALRTSFSETQASSSEVLAASGLPKTTYYRALNDLLKRGTVVNKGSGTRKLLVLAPLPEAA